MIDYKDLYRRYRAATLSPLTTDEAHELLTERFHAYEIPLDTLVDYENDDQVDETRIWRLYTITDPTVLASLYGPEELAHKETDPDEIEDDWQGVFRNGPELVGYNLLIIQHRHGTRTSIVLERDGDTVTGFNVYGTSFFLHDFLYARIGGRDLRIGDLEDESFQHYLECLDGNGLI